MSNKLGSRLAQICTGGNVEEAMKVLEEIKKERRPSASLEQRSMGTQYTPLLIAVMNGRVEIIDLLLQYGADIHATTDERKKNTALHLAAYYGRANVLKVLIAHHADLYRWNADGLLALDLARMRNHTDSARVLLRASEIFKGPIDYKVLAGLPPWKPCYARLIWVLNGAPGHNMVEMALHESQDETTPFKIVQFDPTVVRFQLTGSPREVALSSNVCFHNYKSALFSRDPSIQASKGKVTPTPFFMRVDSDATATRWLDILNMIRNPKSRMGPDTYRALSDTMVEALPVSSSSSASPPPPPPPMPPVSSYPLGPPPPFPQGPPPPFPQGPPPTYEEAMEHIRRQTMRSVCQGCQGPVSPSMDKCEMCLKTENLEMQLAQLAVASSPSPKPMVANPIAAPAAEPESSVNECVICMDQVRNAVCIPCGHLSSCVDCLSAAQVCPICRTAIQTVVKVYTA
ncbi:hypothetical protein AeRB84_011952 [Aphanomyces euteiches]|nr:hypothetical protein AeRB84_011952 [Aphanomyces euteiches]